MVSFRTLGSHRLISHSEKNNSELVKWIVIRTPISKLQHLLSLAVRGLEDLVYIGKKKTLGTSRGIFVLLLKLHHPRCNYTYLLSQLLFFRVLPFVTRIRFLMEIRRANEAALA